MPRDAGTLLPRASSSPYIGDENDPYRSAETLSVRASPSPYIGDYGAFYRSVPEPPIRPSLCARKARHDALRKPEARSTSFPMELGTLELARLVG